MAFPVATLLRNARFYGGDARHDILLRGERVAEVAPSGTINASDAEAIELDGRYVGPGLWDEHLHFTQWTIQRSRLDLAGTRGPAEVLERVAAALQSAPPADGATLTGYGFRDATWTSPTSRAELDALAGDRAVVLISGDLHCAWMTTAAARRLGIAPSDHGEDGMVREGPWIAANASSHERDALTTEAFAAGAADAARRGVVGVVEFEHADNLAEWPARVAAGVRSLRVEAAVWPDRLDAAIAAGHRTGASVDPHGLVSVGRLKVVVDGSLNTRTAWCWDPYPGADPHAAHACGVVTVSPEETRRLMTQARDHGIHASIHAIGDRANSEVLDLFEELGMPGVIEHAQLVRESDFARFAPLGVIASVQPEHAMDDRDAAELHWAGRTGRAFAFGSLLRAGATLRLGSDAPVAPLDPWQAIASAVARSREERDAWHPEQSVPVEVAMAASSRGRTTIAAGDVADLVLVERDPFTASRDELRTMPVAGTLLGGRWTWRGL